MTDVLKIALDRRTKLQDEIKKLDEFIRMADALVRSEAGGDKADGRSVQPMPASAASADAEVEAEAETEAEESPMRAAARKLSDAEVRRAPEADAGQGADAPRPSIIRRGLAG